MDGFHVHIGMAHPCVVYVVKEGGKVKTLEAMPTTKNHGVLWRGRFFDGTGKVYEIKVGEETDTKKPAVESYDWFQK